MVADATVDVIIAAKNESKAIARCLSALSEQNYPMSLVRTFVVDNGSTDNTAQVVADFDSVQLLQLDRGTVGAARNLAIRQGGGNLVAFLDAHSIPHSDWLLQLIRCLQEGKFAACHGAIEYEFSDATIASWSSHYGLSPAQQWERWQSGRWSAYPFIGTGSAICRRQALEEVGMFDESLERCEDLDLSWKLILSGHQLGFTADSKVHHVSHDRWRHFLWKYFQTGRSTAHISLKYSLNRQGGLFPTFAPASDPSLETSLVRFLSVTGYLLELTALKTGVVPAPGVLLSSIGSELRPHFGWNSQVSLSLSDQVVFWRSGTSEYTAVNLRSRQRFVFGGSAYVIFDQLTQCRAREAVLAKLAAFYRLSPAEIQQDVDDLVEQLLEQAILLKHSNIE